MTDDFQTKLLQMRAEGTRDDDERRREAAGVLIVDASLLMTELARFMPDFVSDTERRGYLAAIADIAVQINAVSMSHDRTTGELMRGGHSVSFYPDEAITKGLENR